MTNSRMRGVVLNDEYLHWRLAALLIDRSASADGRRVDRRSRPALASGLAGNRQNPEYHRSRASGVVPVPDVVVAVLRRALKSVGGKIGPVVNRPATTTA